MSNLFGERVLPPELRGKSVDDPHVLAERKKMYDHASNREWHYTTEENYWDLLERARLAIAFIQARKEQTLVVVTHAAFLKFILTVMMYEANATPEHFEAMYHFMLPKNTGITMCEFKTISGTIRNEPQWRLMTFNDYTHLGE